ncbi:hypothetical protein OFDDKENP_00091 [Aeromonas phage B614]|nr:hypothetical protein OFDDKENP_00091 [Aeromonas phage B614]UYD58545.1 hypothetical protein IPAKJDPM_00202 [Aeromonas phage avDM14-QBC]UYD58760.1 hypothetical protein HNNIDBEH_00167 [Aeromonas phage avDM10-HWA]UYD58936.1 hypothetical protein OFOPOMKI_00086 [Aeromonas phage avDM7-IJDJ]
MKITKSTNLQSIDFVGRIAEAATESKTVKITRFETIAAGITVGIVGAGAAMCFIGDIDMARKIFIAGIIAGTAFFVMKKGLMK